ncbi:MAG: zinc metalloprotease HtpX [Deltaproteobacteria bacterium]|nr:zinc metalloprotease HtpX [Deltaproteobacteria bacterium]
MNMIKTTLLLGLLTGLLVLIGGYFGGEAGMIIALVFAAVMNLGSYWFSDKIVLAMYRAKPVDPASAPEIYRIVEGLCLKANLPMPRVFIIEEDAPNAFATGRNQKHAVVAATTGLLKLLNREEIEAVFAHELGHVKNRDILISSIAATIAGAVMILANMAQWAAIFGVGRSSDGEEGGGIVGLLATAIIAPIAAMLIQMAISRSREYLADASGAKFCGNPYALASALEKISSYSRNIHLHANPSTAHMFIINPLSGKALMNLFSTHPPVEERVARLRAMRPY